MRSFLFIVALGVALGVTSVAAAAGEIPQVWKKGYSEFRTTTSYYTTSANFAERGSYESLPGGRSLTNINLRSQLRHNFVQDLSAYVGATISQTSAKAGSVTRENSALSEIYFGVTKTIFRKPNFILLGELEGSFSTNKIDPQTTEALTNDGVDYLLPRLLAKKMMRKFWLGATLGFKLRDEGLSGLLLWSDRVGYNFGKFDASIGMSGFESVKKDEVPQSTRDAVTTRVNAGSFRFYSHNPALMQIDAALDWKATPSLGTSFFASQALDGQRYSSGLTLGFQLRYEFGLSRGSVGKSPKKSPEKEFEVDTNEADPELFEETND
jgi:hypothetical protein